MTIFLFLSLALRPKRDDIESMLPVRAIHVLFLNDFGDIL